MYTGTRFSRRTAPTVEFRIAGLVRGDMGTLRGDMGTPWAQFRVNRVTEQEGPQVALVDPCFSQGGNGVTGQSGGAELNADTSPEAGGPQSRKGSPGALRPLRRDDGYYSYSPPNNQYGDPAMVQVVEEAGDLWMGLHPDKPFGVGDISRPGGGAFPPHTGHRLGLEVDVRPLRLDGRGLPVQVSNPAYSRALTQDLVNVFRLDPRVGTILFNDPGVTTVRPYPGHHNHLHIRVSP